MGDIVRSGDNSQKIIKADIGLTLKRLRIMISEKEVQLDGINVRIQQLKSVEIKNLQLQQDVIVREIQELKVEAQELTRKAMEEGREDAIIDAEFEVKEDQPTG